MPGHDTLIYVSVVCSWVGTDHRACYSQIRFEELLTTRPYAKVFLCLFFVCPERADQKMVRVPADPGRLGGKIPNRSASRSAGMYHAPYPQKREWKR
jgi:hypothetical protein